MNDPSALDQRSRAELIQEARQHGVERPERMTRAELKDEILRRTTRGEEQTEARGLFGVARSMLASVVETGLNLPDAAAMIRGGAPFDARVRLQTPVATVTLAEIYAAQGHKKRALGMLDEVIAQEPDHEVALRLRRELGSDEAPSRELATREDEAARWVETEGEEIQSAQPPVATEVAPSVAEVAPADAAEDPTAEPESIEAAEPVGSADEVAPSVAEAGGSFEAAEPEVKSTPFVPDAFALPSEFPAVVEAASGLAAPQSETSPGVEAPSGEPTESGESTNDDFTTIAGAPNAESSAESSAPSAEASSAETSSAREPLLVLAQQEGGLELYWELSRDALLRSGIDPQEGRPAIRVVGFAPRGAKPTRGETTVTLEADLVEVTSGRVELGDFGRPLVVRAAVGWELGDAFVPLSVGRSYDEWNERALPEEVASRVHAAFGGI